MPVVFSTGYRVNYVAHGTAIPLSNEKYPGILVYYYSNSTYFKTADVGPDGIVTDFISGDFKPDGHKYQQLTPDGPLP